MANGKSQKGGVAGDSSPGHVSFGQAHTTPPVAGTTNSTSRPVSWGGVKLAASAGVQPGLGQFANDIALKHRTRKRRPLQPGGSLAENPAGQA